MMRFTGVDLKLRKHGTKFQVSFCRPSLWDSHVHLMVDLLTLQGQAGSNRVSAVSHQEDTLISFMSKHYLIGGAALLH